jgi:hypothetical protein
MPNTFRNAAQVGNISLTDVYTCPSSNGNGNVSAAVVMSLQATNVTNRADVLTVVWTDSSNGNAVTRLVYQVPVPAQSSIGCLTGKFVLEPGDKIRAQVGTYQAIELSMAVLETS